MEILLYYPCLSRLYKQPKIQKKADKQLIQSRWIQLADNYVYKQVVSIGLNELFVCFLFNLRLLYILILRHGW